MAVPSSTKFNTFDSRMRAEVVKRLQKDKALLARAQSEQQLLLYETELYATYCSFDVLSPKSEGDHKIDIMGDLFANPSQSPLKLRVDVTLVLQKPEDHHENQPRDTQKIHWKQSLTAEELVRETNSIDDDHWRYTYIRLGQRPYTQPATPSNYVAATYIPSSNDIDCDNPAVDSWLKTRKEIYVRKMIIGYFFRDYIHKHQSFHLTTVEAWDFGDYCIGDVENDYKKHKVQADDVYLPPFQKVEKRIQLYPKAKAQLKLYRKGLANPAAVPYMPIYTLNTFDPQKLGLGAPGEKVDAVVRYIDDISVPYEGRDPVKWLPFNAQWTFDADHDFNSVYAAIHRELKQHAQDKKLKPREYRAVRWLFAKPLHGLWSLQLWVLPQPKPGEVSKKMFQFPEAGQGQGGSLTDFLSLARVQQGGYGAKGLYMEAHIIRKPGVDLSDLDTAVRRIEKTLRRLGEPEKEESDVDNGHSTGDEGS